MKKIIISLVILLLFIDVGAWSYPVEIDTSIHPHSTTREFQRMVFKYNNTWFVFYSNGIDGLYRTTVDGGVTWSSASKIISAPNGSSGIDIILDKDTFYYFYIHYPGNFSPELYKKYPPYTVVKKGKIHGRSISWEYQHIIKGLGGYTAVSKNSNGYFYVISRVYDPVKKTQKILFTKNKSSADISDWEIPQQAINHVTKGNFAADLVTLDDNKAYIIAKSDVSGRLYGNFYDGNQWRPHDIFLSDMTNIPGEDKRMSAEFESKNRILHLVYVDRNSVLNYRTLPYPYGESDWSAPVKLVSAEVLSAVLSIDETVDPAHLRVTYVKFDGKSDQIYQMKKGAFSWNNEPILVSEGKGNENLYPSVSKSFTDNSNIGVLYEKKSDAGGVSPYIVMFSVIDTIPPKPPTNLTQLNQTANRMTLKWKPPGKAIDGDLPSYYKIYRNSNLIGKCSTTYFNDSKLKPNTQYHYNVFSVDDVFNESRTSASGTFKTLPAPSNGSVIYDQKKAHIKYKEITRVFQFEKGSSSSSFKMLSFDSKNEIISGKELPVRIRWGYEMRMLLEFSDIFGSNETQIPYGVKIKKATLSLKTSSSGTKGTVLICRVTDPDGKGFWQKKSFLNGASWKYRNILWHVPWADLSQGGGTYSPNDIVLISDLSPNTRYNIDVTSHLQAWSNGSVAQGWLIKNTYDDGKALLIYSFHSSINNRPKLTVVFEKEEKR